MALLMMASVIMPLAVQARFCEKVAVTGGRITKGSAASLNAADGQLLQVVSQRTNSRMVQMADVAMLFKIPEAVSLIDVAAMQITLRANASMPKILVMVEAYDHKAKKWVALDSLRLPLLLQRNDFGIKNAKPFINPKTRELRLRIRSKKETQDPYYLRLDNVHLVGIRKEGLKDYGDLSWEDVNIMRKIIAKSRGDEFFASFKGQLGKR